jgi:hypothetical protein
MSVGQKKSNGKNHAQNTSIISRIPMQLLWWRNIGMMRFRVRRDKSDLDFP